MRLKLFAATVVVLAGCDLHSTTKATAGGAEPVTPPALTSVDQTAVAVAGELSFTGTGFLTDSGFVELTFQGTYHRADGSGSDPVSYALRPLPTATGVAWNPFGPFRIPFGDGRTLGTFVGTVTAANVGPNGERATSAPLSVSVQVLPSLIVNSLAPLTAASCPGPVKRLLGGFPYGITVEAVGFAPQSFTYGQASPGFSPPPLTHAAQGQSDSFGQNNELFFPAVPNGTAFYVTDFSIESLGTDGNTYQSTYRLGVHNPVEYIPTGPAQVAEYEAPKAVGGCVPGNPYGQVSLTYTDTEDDSRERQVAYSWDQSWQAGTPTNFVSLSVQNSLNSGWTAGWEVGETPLLPTAGWSQAEVVATAVPDGGFPNNCCNDAVQTSNGPSCGEACPPPQTIPFTSIDQPYNLDSDGAVQDAMEVAIGLDPLGAPLTPGADVAGVVGADYSTADTESWALAAPNLPIVFPGSNGFWQVSSDSNFTVGNTATLSPGFDGWWYRQATRLAYPGEVVTYDQCSEPTVAASTYFYDYTWAAELSVGHGCSVDKMPIPTAFPPAQCKIGCSDD